MSLCILQVKKLCFHPVQPWLAYADVNQGLTVWDWSSQQVDLPFRISQATIRLPCHYHHCKWAQQ